MPVRVLWVIKGLGPGGAETLLANSAQVLDRQAFDVDCVFVRPDKDHLADRLVSAGVGTICLGRRRVDPWWPARLVRLVRSGGYQVVHVHSPLPGAAARLAARTMGRHRPRVVTTEHNAWGTFTTPTRLLNRLTSRWDDATFAVSDEVRASMRGRTRRRATTLLHGIDVAAVRALRSERDAVRHELGIGADDFVIGTVANFREQKDYPTLLRAARYYLDGGGRATWLVVGQGPLEQQTRALAAELGLDDHVRFTGFRADALRVQSAFDVFTLSSRWEGLPVALMEAFAMGLPVAATSVGGVGEVLVDGSSAVLVPPGDAAALSVAWRRLGDEPVLRARVASASSLLADDFDVRRAQRAIEGTYRRLCSDTPSAHAPTPTTSTRKRLIEGFDIRPLRDDDEPAVLRMLGRSLGWNDDPRFRDLYRWKHVDNAFGPSFGWVATDAGRVVGVRLFMRWDFIRGGEVLHAVRAVDTATDPDYQGRGLFTALTKHGLDEVREAGIDFVFNTPNAQSKPGYLKMGWQVVGRVSASVRPVGATSILRLARSRTSADHWSMPLDIGVPIDRWLGAHAVDEMQASLDVRSLRTSIDERFLQWRYGMPHLHYRVVGDGDGAVVVRARRRGRSVELVTASALGASARQTGAAALGAARVSGADHVLRVSRQTPPGYVHIPSLGPVLTWRSVCAHAMPALSNWTLEMGDIELM